MDYGLNALAAACSSTSLVKSAGNPQPLNRGLHHRRMTAELAIISETRTSCITACSTCKQAVCGRCASLTTVVVYYYQRVSHSANASNIFPEGVASKLLWCCAWKHHHQFFPSCSNIKCTKLSCLNFSKCRAQCQKEQFLLQYFQSCTSLLYQHTGVTATWRN